MNRFSWNFQQRSVVSGGTIWNICGMLRLTPWIQGSFSIYLICVCNQHYGISDGWIFKKFSGYGHKKELARLFHAWLDCLTLLKLCAAEACALGELLVLYWNTLWVFFRLWMCFCVTNFCSKIEPCTCGVLPRRWFITIKMMIGFVLRNTLTKGVIRWFFLIHKQYSSCCLLL